jgi:hypothetical protein
MMRFVVSLSLAVIICSPSLASTSHSTRAAEDGIGYRSNLLDPANPYAAHPSFLFKTLLLRFGLLPSDENRNMRPTDKQYLDRVKQLLSTTGATTENSTPLQAYHYAYGICETNDYPAALEYMEQLVASLGKNEASDRLILARHRLLALCERKEHEQLEFFKEFVSALSPAKFKGDARFWVTYLLAAANFYQGMNVEAAKLFSESGSIRHSSSPWLRDTANYMLVRTSRALVENRKIETAQFIKVIELHQSEHLASRYFETVENYRRLARVFHHCDYGKHRLQWASCRHEKRNDPVYRKLLAEHFSKYFIPNIPDDQLSQRLEVFREMTFLGEAPSMSGSPILMVYGLLLDIRNGFYRTDVVKEDWGSRIRALDGSFRGYPGLRSYAQLLGLYENKDYESVIKLPYTKARFGVLFADAKVLLARAHSALRQYDKAIQAWQALSLETPIYNGLTEIANAYVRKGRFSDFAYYRAGWLTDLDPRTFFLGEGYGYHRNEFDIEPRTFFALSTPYLNLLKRGFESFVKPASARSVYLDNSLPPIIRFFAAEPQMRSHLLSGNHWKFLQIWEDVFSLNFKLTTSMYPVPNTRGRRLIDGYVAIRSSVSELIQDPKNAVAMTELGNFIYRYSLFPKCSGESLWELNLSECSPPNKKNVPPIDLFSKALSIFQEKSDREMAEARLLRIMILCFKSSKSSCVRDSEIDVSKSVRKSWFRRLHKYFPITARKTPYWY